MPPKPILTIKAPRLSLELSGLEKAAQALNFSSKGL